MDILEKEIEDIVYDTDNSLLQQRGLHIAGRKFRQVNLGSYGIADIVAIDIDKYGPKHWDITITIIELKQKTVDVNTLMQACRYRRGIEKIIEKDLNLKHSSITYQILLIGKEIQNKGDFVFLSDAMENLTISTVSIDLVNGVNFTTQYGFSHSNEVRGTLTKSYKDALKYLIHLAGGRLRERIKRHGEKI